MRMIKGSEVERGQTIKANGRIYKVCEIEEPDFVGARLADLQTSSGEFVTFNLFDDSEYELRKSPADPRPQIVRVRLTPALAASVERARLAGETTEQALLRLVRQALDDWGG